MADINKCPYCYRTLGTWKHDPLLIPLGSKYEFTDETTLSEVLEDKDRLYKGLSICILDDIKEIQDSLKQLEQDKLLEINRTTFSPINSSGIFQFTGNHLKEMRDSVEKILNELGLTKNEFFNYDEEGNHIIHPLGDKTEWTDNITEATDLSKFQIKYIHIEELRHFLDIAGFYEWWRNNEESTSDEVLFIANGTNMTLRPFNDIIIGGHELGDGAWSMSGLWRPSSTPVGVNVECKILLKYNIDEPNHKGKFQINFEINVVNLPANKESVNDLWAILTPVVDSPVFTNKETIDNEVVHKINTLRMIENNLSGGAFEGNPGGVELEVTMIKDDISTVEITFFSGLDDQTIGNLNGFFSDSFGAVYNNADIVTFKIKSIKVSFQKFIYTNTIQPFIASLFNLQIF